MNNKFNDYLENFEKTLNTIENIDLTRYYNNKKGLKISKSILNKNRLLGYYDPFYNILNVSKMDSDIINHELLHMASSKCIYDDNKIVVLGGFQIQTKVDDKVYSTGRSLDEGYTEKIMRKYFPSKEKKDFDSWEIDIEIISFLDLIIGENKMQQLYFDEGLSGLIAELSKYSEQDDIFMFLSYSDLLYDHFRNPKKANSSQNNSSTYLKPIFKFLINTYSKKIEIDLGKEAKEKFLKNVNFFDRDYLDSNDGKISRVA